MKLKINSKYLTFPINSDAEQKKVLIYEDETLIYELDCRIDSENPNFSAYADVSRFMGKEVEINLSSGEDLDIGFAESIDFPDLYHEDWRPQVHFTVKNGWNNDPNGLILLGGVYHMFYQYNPCGTDWGNMHWGHAESYDLLHWEEKDIALFPDELGTMYSGSAYEDKENLSGFGEGAMLLYYTAAGRRTLLSNSQLNTQCLAYSLDGGKTIKKYERNPIVPSITQHNRDPKVVFVPEIKKHIMALYIDKSRYHLLSSDNLVSWQHFDEFFIEGDSECPDIYSLTCEGEKKWVISGASDRYIIGHFEEDAFVVESEPKRLTYSKIGYAAQSYSGTGERVVRITWDKLKIPNARASQQMGVPTEMKLIKKNGEYLLSSLPIEEFASLREEKKHCFGEVFGEVGFEADGYAYDLLLSGDYTEGEEINLNLFGEVLTLNTDKNEITFGENVCPLSFMRERIDVRVIIDRDSVEVFSDGGIFSATYFNIPSGENKRITLSGNSKSKLSFECYSLKSIYEN